VRDTRSHPRFMLTPASIAWIDGVELDAFTLWALLQLYQARVGGTALVPKSKLKVATARRMSQKRIDAAVAELVDEGQVIDRGDALELVVWEQPPVETWQDDTLRFRYLRNNRLGKMGDLCAFVKQRDRSLCRYCGIRVNWTDKRGGDGATYDHVDPDGDNTRDNVVVACRRCNGRKRDRTPEQAGMPLLKPGTAATAAAASAATGTGSDLPRGGESSTAEHHTDPDPTQVRPKSGSKSARARPRDRTDPDPTQVAPLRSAESRSARPDDGSVPRLMQSAGGFVRVRPTDPAHPIHHHTGDPA
jgi:5-methylcytosine-specific restriction endonuclease McrA